MKPIHLVLVFVTVLIFSCDRPECTNTNSVFDDNPPNSEVYKQELVEELHDLETSELRYWLQKYEEKSGTEYLYFRVQGDGLCAILVLTIDHWEGLELVKENKGEGYRGAEFVGLEYDVKTEYDHTQFLYRSVDHTID